MQGMPANIRGRADSYRTHRYPSTAITAADTSSVAVIYLQHNCYAKSLVRPTV